MTVCTTYSCEKYIQCLRASINNDGTHTARSYGTEGTGTINSNGDYEEKYLCGSAGNYALYMPIEIDRDRKVNDE